MGKWVLPFAVIDDAGQLHKNRGRSLGAYSVYESVRTFLLHYRFDQPQFTEYFMEFNKEFDASGLACPLPIVKTKKSLQDMTSGQVLRVISTDPGSVCDMAAFAEQTGHALLQQGEEAGKFVFFIKKT